MGGKVHKSSGRNYDLVKVAVLLQKNSISPNFTDYICCSAGQWARIYPCGGPKKIFWVYGRWRVAASSIAVEALYYMGQVAGSNPWPATGSTQPFFSFAQMEEQWVRSLALGVKSRQGEHLTTAPSLHLPGWLRKNQIPYVVPGSGPKWPVA